MQDFKDLIVWQKSHQLTLAMYRVTTGFPKHELYGLTSQIRRATASIPANIAEGCGRGSDPDFARILQIAFGSACEVEYHLILSRDLSLLAAETYSALQSDLIGVKRMLTSLLKKVRGSANS